MAIVGGGPVGLECLLRARAEGWDARLYERGRVGENVRAWGHVRMFSPWRMNVSAAGRRAIGLDERTLDETPTGAEVLAEYLEPLAALPELRDRIELGTDVRAIGRDGLLKGEAIRSPARAERPFLLLLDGPAGERLVEADVVVFAGGTLATPNRLGPGGLPAPGEAAASAVERVLPDLADRDRDRFAGRRVAVVGAGHSAATAITGFADLAAGGDPARVIWITRSSAGRPVVEIADDPLPERERVARAANDVAGGAAWLDRRPGAQVREIAPADGGWRVRVDGPAAGAVRVDRILALVGYRPDLAPLRELQAQTCWATEGTYPLAAALLADASGDCLTTGAGLDAASLVHPEPGLFVLGSMSYGRNSTFLLRSGLRQIDDLFALLAGGAPVQGPSGSARPNRNTDPSPVST